MKIEKLTDNKLRIILNIDDLAKKNIDVHSIIKNSEGTHSFFRKILKEAQREVDFNTDDSRVLIDAFLSSEGFFILTFTKIECTSKNITSKYKPNPKRKSINYLSSTAVYEFNSLDDVSDFSTYIKNSKLRDIKNIAKNISLYEYKSRYFLIFSGINTDFEKLEIFYASISEFAKLVSNSKYFASRLSEYGTVIFKNKKKLIA